MQAWTGFWCCKVLCRRFCLGIAGILLQGGSGLGGIIALALRTNPNTPFSLWTVGAVVIGVLAGTALFTIGMCYHLKQSQAARLDRHGSAR